MPEYGLFHRPSRLDFNQPSEPPLPKILKQEAERQRQTQEAQAATIRISQKATELLHQNEKSIAELKRIADAAEHRAQLAEKEAETAKRDAHFSKAMAVLALLVSTGSLVVAIVALFVR